MEIEIIKKLIKNNIRGHNKMCRDVQVAEQYYLKKNDILNKYSRREEFSNPLRTADNRIASNFYSLLVNQKASYMFTAPPLFDVGNKKTNKEIVEILGDKYAKVCKDLCINASNAAVAWLHCWIDENNIFQYSVIDSKQIIPVWDSSIEKNLKAVLRVYDMSEEDGTIYNVYEFWDCEKCYVYRKKNRDSYDELKEYSFFRITSVSLPDSYDESNVYEHAFKEVPFIPFFNNCSITNDLDAVKDLIDCYDKVYSGFINDLEDIQEVIFILSGYSGTNMDEFLEKIKKYKTIKTDPTNSGQSGLTTLTIDIPVEARNIMLSMTRKSIFEQGQGIDPDPQNFGNSSGVALSYLYSLLELKAGLMETEFKLSFGRLIRLICQRLGKEAKTIVQTWTRTSVSNDAELSDIAQKSIGVISQKTIVKNHPWVEDPERELKEIQKEEKEKMEQFNPYSAAFNDNNKEEDVDNEELDGGVNAENK